MKTQIISLISFAFALSAQASIPCDQIDLSGKWTPETSSAVAVSVELTKTKDGFYAGIDTEIGLDDLSTGLENPYYKLKIRFDLTVGPNCNVLWKDQDQNVHDYRVYEEATRIVPDEDTQFDDYKVFKSNEGMRNLTINAKDSDSKTLIMTDSEGGVHRWHR